MRLGVFAQPAENVARWRDLGADTFLGWASSKQTSGADPIKDRDEQLKWRQAVKASGAKYVDYVLPDWRITPTADQLKLMVDDAGCLGFFGPDEPNISPPTDTTGKVWRVSVQQWDAYWNPILAADPGNTKIRVGDFAGNKLSAAWGSYTGADMVPYLPPLTALATNWHPRNTYGDTRPDCDDYPARAVSMLMRRRLPSQRVWYISEIADEDLQNSPNGRAPLRSEVETQLAKVKAEAGAEYEGLIFFPQKPRVGASHVFDNTTPDQRETVRAIFAAFKPDPIAVLDAKVEAQGEVIKQQAKVIADHEAKMQKMLEALQ